MTELSHTCNQIRLVSNFQDLVAAPFTGEINAICWTRALAFDFGEIVSKLEKSGNITTVEEDDLLALKLTEQGQHAREILLGDFSALKAVGASPVLNVITYYDRDDSNRFFPTDVYSFHADRSPVPTNTYLCTYHGEPSEILPNSQGIKKVLIPEIRDQLRKQYNGSEAGFESYLAENFFDLHYGAKPGARPVSLGQGNLWKLAVDHPGSLVAPCIHRAPIERSGISRLLMIC
jgi:hypothetical protein